MTSLLKIWSSIVHEYPPQLIDTVGTTIIQLIFFWGTCAFFLSLDTLFPNFSHRHKIQPIPKQPTRVEIWDCFKLVLRNQGISTGLDISLSYLGYVARNPPPLRVESTFPALSEVARDILICIVLREILFYYGHRTLHSSIFYTRIHKLHHRFTAPVALSAQYAHPLEHIVANIIPVSIPPMLLHSHVITFWIFLAFELVETTCVHSGYDFLNGAAKMHDRHHMLFDVNFGTVGLLDWIHGTDWETKEKAKKAQ